MHGTMSLLWDTWTKLLSPSQRLRCIYFGKNGKKLKKLSPMPINSILIIWSSLSPVEIMRKTILLLDQFSNQLKICLCPNFLQRNHIVARIVDEKLSNRLHTSLTILRNIWNAPGMSNRTKAWKIIISRITRASTFQIASCHKTISS